MRQACFLKALKQQNITRIMIITIVSTLDSWCLLSCRCAGQYESLLRSALSLYRLQAASLLRLASSLTEKTAGLAKET
jgi:hypothetical protein